MKKRIMTLIKNYENFIKYCLIGISGATIDFIVFYILTRYLGIHYQYANIISISIGITNNFLLNIKFNFKTKNYLYRRFLSFFLIGIGGMIISGFLLYILVDKLNFTAILAKFITIFIVTIVQYTLNKAISFKKTN